MDGWSRKNVSQVIYCCLWGKMSWKRPSGARFSGLWNANVRTEMQTHSGSSSSCRTHLLRSDAHMSTALWVCSSPENLDLLEDI